MDKTNEKIEMENHETITQKRLVFSIKEIVWGISLLVALLGVYTAIEMKFRDIEVNIREIELKIDQFEKNNLNTSLKFDKIDAKLDGIQNDVTDIKIKSAKTEK